MKFAILLMLFAFVTASHAVEVRRSHYWPLGKAKGPPLYVQETRITAAENGELSWSATIKDRDGKLLMTEQAKLRGGRIVSQTMEQLQTGEAWSLERVDGKATFATFKIVEGKHVKSEEPRTVSVGMDFLTGPSTEAYFQSNWAALEEGKNVTGEFGVFELAKPIGFHFRKLASTEDTVDIRMKPSGFLASMFLDPIIITVDKSSKRILKYRGRTPLKEKAGTKWKAFDAEIHYLPPEQI